MPDIGTSLGNYRLVEELSGGTFGRVYRAEHTLIPTFQVAIKFLRTERIESSQERERFLQEASFLVSLRHPSILSILDVGVNENIPLTSLTALIILSAGSTYW